MQFCQTDSKPIKREGGWPDLNWEFPSIFVEDDVDVFPESLLGHSFVLPQYFT